MVEQLLVVLGRNHTPANHLGCAVIVMCSRAIRCGKVMEWIEKIGEYIVD